MNTQIACGVVLALAAGMTNGQTVVFENLPDQINAGVADSSGFGPENRSADNFSLSTTETIGSIQFWGLWFENNIGAENFTAVFYEDVAGSPGSILTTIDLVNTTSSPTGTDVFGFDEYLHTADLATSFTADAGTTYYLSIFNDSGLGDNGTWAWESSSAEGVGWLSQDFGANFASDDRIGGFAFRLVNVPSPAATTLLGLGGLIATRRRR